MTRLICTASGFATMPDNNQRVEEQGQHQKPDHDSNDQSSGEHRRLIMV